MCVCVFVCLCVCISCVLFAVIVVKLYNIIESGGS